MRSGRNEKLKIGGDEQARTRGKQHRTAPFRTEPDQGDTFSAENDSPDTFDAPTAGWKH
ncbi:hypothetical protein F4561_000073 [Lipingzhangella halophila]|uniref:Uncharacterized protein n=1 Tax=Lipingzhangella halophila TaxID=1783352 RepID=A0A7W7RC45_9ACTN|nr:hypothetical protein [Lipingzhangella halophila]MBB4929253.1 hypothetical protein [Lipingzhangella halophila]